MEGDGNQLVEFQVYERLSNGNYDLVGVNRFMAKPVNGVLILPVREQHQITVHNNHVVGLFINGDLWSVVYSYSQDIAALYFPTHNPLNLIDSSAEEWNVLQGAPIINVTISKEIVASTYHIVITYNYGGVTAVQMGVLSHSMKISNMI